MRKMELTSKDKRQIGVTIHTNVSQYVAYSKDNKAVLGLL